LENFFSKDWFCVGRADALSNTGDYTTCELARQPIVMIRDRDGELRALSNVDPAARSREHPFYCLPLPCLDLQP
jgi:phenylpropionate dioxygenase-like ring-hydroxylating dioxygenase large terminal subunit